VFGDEAAKFQINHTIVGTSGAGDTYQFLQKIEDVRRLGGKTVTLSFWASSATGTFKLGVVMGQLFGTGGSPSSPVYTTGQDVSVTTTWTRYVLTFSVPSTSGKTLGTAGGDCTQVIFVLSQQGGTVGVQSWTLALWGVQLELGTVATPLEKLDPVTQLQQAQRFFQAHTNFQPYLYAPAASGVSTDFAFPVTMRATPQITYTTVSYGNASGITALAYTASHLTTQFTVTLAGTGVAFFGFTASADL
jgi:hypothetical protein